MTSIFAGYGRRLSMGTFLGVYGKSSPEIFRINRLSQFHLELSQSRLNVAKNHHDIAGTEGLKIEKSIPEYDFREAKMKISNSPLPTR